MGLKTPLSLAVLHYQTVTLKALALKFTSTANGSSLFTSLLLRWLFVEPTHFHFAVDTFALKFFLQSTQSLVHIIIPNGNLHGLHLPFYSHNLRCGTSGSHRRARVI